MLIICSECGKEYSDQAKSCPHCGAITSQNRYISNNMSGSYNRNINYPSQNNNINGTNGSGCGVVLVIIIALILGFIGFKLFFGSLSLLGLDKDTMESTFKDAWDEDFFGDGDTSSNSSLFSNDKVYNIGEKITTDEFEITVIDVEEKSTVGTDTSAGDGNTFICVTIKIKNITGKSIGIASRPNYNLVDGKDINYYNEFFASLEYQVEKGNGNQPDLNPGVTIYDNEVFKIDKKYYTQNTFNLEIWAGETILVKIK